MYEHDATYAPIEAFVDELVRGGIRHACVSPGARSTPLALVMATYPGLRAWSHIDERSGSFFGLGIAKATRQPVAIVCTSGTAAANLLPAVIEAAHAHVPLLVLTADRPPELRDCGAGQTIDQLKLYGTHAKWFVEAATSEVGARYFRALACRAIAAACTNPPGPVHVNFPFREPLVPTSVGLASAVVPSDGARASARPYTVVHRPTVLPTEATIAELAVTLASAPQGLIACGPYDSSEGLGVAVAALAAHLDYPILADPLSQLRTGPHDRRLIVGLYDALLRDEAFCSRMSPDVVLRIGPMLTSKAFLQYLQRHPNCRQIVVDPFGPWNDPNLLAADIVRAEPLALCRAVAERVASGRDHHEWSAAWLEADRQAATAVDAQLAATAELFEGKVFRELAGLLPDGAQLYVGSSMPVRDLETFWPAGSPRIRFLANRGANGIDGFVSSGLGAAAVSEQPTVMVTGDLGFYHDLNGLLAVKRYGVRATIIVLNNDGGGIFSFLPQAQCETAFEAFFLTPHGLDFRGVVEMYGAAFIRIASWEQFRAAVRTAISADRTTVIEVPVDRARNVELHRTIWTVARPAPPSGR